MEEQIRKLKNKSVIIIILALLAITWQFLSYLTIKDYIQMTDFSSFEVIIVYSSYLFLAILFLSLLSLTFTAYRVSMKFNSERKKEEQIKTDTSETSLELPKE